MPAPVDGFERRTHRRGAAGRSRRRKAPKLGRSNGLLETVSPPYRDRERERGANAHLALDPDLAPVELDELPTQGQSQAGALLLGRAGPDLTELLEDGFLILRRDADTGVAHRDLDGPVHWHGPDVDPAA